MQRRRLQPNLSDDQHADRHADRADDEQGLAPEAVNGPHGVEREEDPEGRVQRVDQRDRAG